MESLSHTRRRGETCNTKTDSVHGSQTDIAGEEDPRTPGDETWTKNYRTTG